MGKAIAVSILLAISVALTFTAVVYGQYGEAAIATAILTYKLAQ